MIAYKYRAIARKKRNEMKQKMSEAAREEQRKHEVAVLFSNNCRRN